MLSVRHSSRIHKIISSCPTEKRHLKDIDVIFKNINIYIYTYKLLKYDAFVS